MISFLYSTVGIIVAFGYLPQIARLLRSKTRCDDISIPAWIIWNYTAIISLLYGYFDLSDLKLTIVNLVNVVCISSIILITLFKRKKYRQCAFGYEENNQ